MYQKIKNIMKNPKIYCLLLLASSIVISCNKQEPKTDSLPMNLDEANLTWRSHYDSIAHKVYYTGEWAGWGWQYGDDSIKPSADFSAYDQLVVTLDSVVCDSTTLFLNARYTNNDVITSSSAPVVDGKSTLRIDLDSVGKSHLLEFYVMSKLPCELVITSVTFKKAIKYGEKHKIKVNDGFIDAKEFESYSDDALISFNYYAEGEMTYVSDSGTIERMDNWGIGIICSSVDVIEAICPGQRLILKNLGEQSFTCRLGDIKYMLELKDDDGEQGLYWVVWTGGHLTDVHLLDATIQEAIQ